MQAVAHLALPADPSSTYFYSNCVRAAGRHLASANAIMATCKRELPAQDSVVNAMRSTASARHDLMIVHGETVEQERKKQKIIDDREKKAEYMRKRRAEQREFEQKKAIRRHANKMRMRVKRAADKEIAALALAAEAEPVLPIKDVNYENVPIFDLWHRARAPTVVSTLMKELALGNAAQEVMIAGYINELRKNLIVFPQYGMLAIEDGVVDDGMNVMDTDVESHVDTEEDFDGVESDVMEVDQVDSNHDDDDTLSMGSRKAM